MVKFFPIVAAGLFIIFCSSKALEKNDVTYFEGIIKYKTEFVIKTDKVTFGYLDNMIGKTADLYFKEGNFIELYDTGFMLSQLYKRKENKTYVKKNAYDSLFWYTCSQKAQPIIKYEINRKKETILGIICDEYITYYDNKVVTFYFNSDTLRINPEWYSEFTLSNKNVNVKRMRAMYLKYKLDYPDFCLTVTATEIHEQPVNEDVFNLNPSAVLVKDPLYN